MAKTASRKRGAVAKIIEVGYDLPAQKGGVPFFRVGALANTNAKDWTELLNTMAEIQYNDFYGRKVAEMLGFHGNVGYFSLVEFGREYSPVLYLHFNEQKRPELARGDTEEVDTYVRMLGIEYGITPSEADWDSGRRCLRLWWD